MLCVLGVWRGVAGATVAGTLACLGSTASYGATFAYMQRFLASGLAYVLNLGVVRAAGPTVASTVTYVIRCGRRPSGPCC